MDVLHNRNHPNTFAATQVCPLLKGKTIGFISLQCTCEDGTLKIKQNKTE
jgi:hypothetical protein